MSPRRVPNSGDSIQNRPCAATTERSPISISLRAFLASFAIVRRPHLSSSRRSSLSVSRPLFGLMRTGVVALKRAIFASSRIGRKNFRMVGARTTHAAKRWIAFRVLKVHGRADSAASSLRRPSMSRPTNQEKPFVTRSCGRMNCRWVSLVFGSITRR